MSHFEALFSIGHLHAKVAAANLNQTCGSCHYLFFLMRGRIIIQTFAAIELSFFNYSVAKSC